MPFEVYNPWGTNSSGWALGTYEGHQVYGLFNASAAFISQNFVSQSIGSGSALTSSDHGLMTGGTEVMKLGPVVSINKRPSEGVQLGTEVKTVFNDVVTMNHRFFRKPAFQFKTPVA